MNKESNRTRLYELILQAFEGTITEENFFSLQALLKDNPVNQGKYAEMAFLFTTLKNSGQLFKSEDILDMAVWKALSEYERAAQAIEVSSDQPDQQEEFERVSVRVPEKRKISKFNIFTLVASAAILILAVVFTKYAPPAGGVLVGRLTQTVDAQWESADGDIVVGSELRAGPLKLTKGLAEILFEDGATVILDAPVECILESPHQMYIAAGKAVASIHGTDKTAFVIRSPYGTVVDYGTEFGVQVGSGQIETLVFQGSVALRDGDDPIKFSNTLNLKAGEGGRVKLDRKPEKEQIDHSQFIRNDEFNIRYQASIGSPYHRWLANSYQLRRDPDLVTYYTFEKDLNFPSRIANKANITKGLFDVDMNAIPGQQRPTWTSGRWDQKEALKFDRQQSQYLKVIGASPLYQNGPITLAAWIKCSGETDGGHILSNRMENLGSCNYQFGYKVRKPDGYNVERPNLIQLARKMSKDDDQQIYSPILNADPDWLFIAVTHDQHTVSFYQNGKLVHSQAWEVQLNPVEADLWIGSDGSTGYLDRFFNGVMDELVILKRVLNPNDIREMYESGKP
jgi:hypothetical protein